ncbi:MAG: CPBP family intramembrane metalloprotease [Niabella sp.]|nr:CPBP family intramembrane metalloprotease [Niabella sp.]
MPSQKPLRILFRTLLFYCGATLLFIIVSALVPALKLRPVPLVTIGTAVVLTFILLVIFCRWNNSSLKAAGISFQRKSLSYFFMGYILGLVLIIAWVLLTLVLTPYQLSLNAGSHISAVPSAFLLFLFVAIREELVYRSYFLQSLTTAFTTIIALLIVTIVFILEHRAAGISWKTSIIGSGLGGVLFGIAAIKTKGIALPVGLHSAWNFGRWAFGLTGSRGIWHYTNTYGNSIKDETATLTTYAIVLLIAIIFLWLLPINKISTRFNL